MSNNSNIEQTMSTIERKLQFQNWFKVNSSLLTAEQSNSVKSAFLYLLDELLPYDERKARIENYKDSRAEGRNELNETIKNLEIAKEKLNDFIKHWNENLNHQNINLESIHDVKTNVENQIYYCSKTETIEEQEMPKDMKPARDFYLINTALIRLYKLMDDENIELNTQVKLILTLYRAFDFEDYCNIDDKMSEGRIRTNRRKLLNTSQ